MPMKRITIFLILALSGEYVLSSEVFHVSDRFFEKTEDDAQKVLDKPKKCPDGSKFLVLDMNIDSDGNEIDVATCFYSGELPLAVDHTWMNGKKIHEITYIPNITQDIPHGIEKSKLSEDTFLISEHCNGVIVRQEIVDSKGNVEGILLYLANKYFSSSETKAPKPDVVINLIEPSKSVISEKLKNFSSCDFSGYSKGAVFNRVAGGF